MNSYHVVAMIFGITVMMLLVRYTDILGTPMITYCSGYTNFTNGTGSPCYKGNNTDLLTQLGATAFNVNTLFIIAPIFATAAVLTGLNLLAVIPIVMMIFLYNFVVMPTEFFSLMGLPEPFPTLFSIVFYLTFVMVFISFIRTGQ